MFFAPRISFIFNIHPNHLSPKLRQVTARKRLKQLQKVREYNQFQMKRVLLPQFFCFNVNGVMCFAVYVEPYFRRCQCQRPVFQNNNIFRLKNHKNI